MLIPRQRVAVLYGGSSAEREVSLESGQAVAAALAARGHLVALIDPVTRPVSHVDWSRFDSAFIALHGTYGEDGTVQSELDRLGVSYTGSDAATSALAFDKLQTKRRVHAAGVRTPAYVEIDHRQAGSTIEILADQLGYPLVVKPNAQGSSVGVTIVHSRDQLADAVPQCFAHGTRGLLETAVVGEEWTVGLVDQRCLPPIRITSARTFYDYQAKYEDNRTDYHVSDPDSSVPLVKNLQQLAQRACLAVGTSGIARVDFRLCVSGEPWFLEVNTVPGFTSHSLIPKAAAAEGIDLGELCERVLPVRSGVRRAG